MALLGYRSAMGVDRDRQCPVCGAPIDCRTARTAETCGGWQCRRTHRVEQVRRQEKQRRQEHHRVCLERATALQDTIAPACSRDDPAAYTVIVTPANKRRLVPLPRSRRYRFARRLMELIEEALRSPPPAVLLNQAADEIPASALPILANACATCRGHCCLRGGTRAFMDASTIHRYRARHPGAGLRQIMEAYCRLLPDTAYQDSCVFHSSAGCTLPGEMRSNTCLNTVCGALIEIRLRITMDGETKFFLAASDRRGVVRSEFIECK